jgi:hypothetical protein
MSANYNGQDPFTANAYIAGKGYWLTVYLATDEDDRDAASVSVGLEGVTDRTNWLAWRMVNGLEGGTYGAVITWNGAQTFNNIATFGNDILVNGQGRFANWPKLEGSKVVKRRAWRIANGTYDADGANSGAPLRYHGWLDNGDTNPVPCIKTTAITSGSNVTLVELLELPGEGRLDSVKVTCRGLTPANNAVPAIVAYPTFEIVEWSGTSAIAVATPAVASGHSMTDWQSVREVTLTPTSTLTINKNKHYGVRISHPVGGVGQAASMRVFDFESTITLFTIPQ